MANGSLVADFVNPSLPTLVFRGVLQQTCMFANLFFGVRDTVQGLPVYRVGLPVSY